MQPQVHQIGKEFYLLRSEEEYFHRNIYIKRFIGTHGESINMIMDPGTAVDYPVLSRVLKDLIGGIKNLHIIFLSHQDPDVSSNTPAILASAPKAIVFSSIDSWRLIKMYGIPENRFRAVEDLKFDTIKLKNTGHYIQFVPAKYCHFRGGMMFYDHESRILFSGDFLAGVDTRKGDGIYANEDSWQGISLFHQIYMPSKKAIQMTVDRIGLLNPIPDIIAPQHGDVIKDGYVSEFLGRLASLDVGVDNEEWNQEKIENLIVALNNFLEMLKMMYPEVYAAFLQSLTSSKEFTPSFKLSGEIIAEIKLLPNDAIYHFWKSLLGVTGKDMIDELRGLLVNSLTNFGLEIPEFLKVEEGKAASEELEDLF